MNRLIVLLLAAVLSTPALAHKPSDAYLTVIRDERTSPVNGTSPLRDRTGASARRQWLGEITGAKCGQENAIGAGTQRLALSPAAERGSGHRIADRYAHGGAYAVLPLAGNCPHSGPTVAIEYSLLFDLDPQHRGLLNFVEGGESRSLVYSNDHTRQIVGGETAGAMAQFTAFVHEGVWHIWLGFDHILFLLSLLLPAVLVRRRGKWRAAPDFKGSFWDVARIVTAFTVAHSITLTLAALGIVSLPSRWVESAIALSVVLAALNNVFPIVERGRWIAAFAFGLLHGFGFAGALQDLGLPTGSLALSLAGFNIGVELGQLAIVAAFLPVAFALRTTWAYRRVVLAGGSVVIVAIAGVWLAERAFDLPIFAALASG
jgi:hypothetical protein